MSDIKYGRIFTEEELRGALAQVTGNTDWSDASITDVAAVVERPRLSVDEPVFVIRAQDLASLPTIINYATNAANAGAGDELLQGVSDTASDFALWQEDNKDRLKVPD